MNVSDIPQEMMEKIRLQYESNPEVRNLRTRQQYFQSVGKYQEALELAKTLENLYAVVLRGYMDKAEREAVVFDSETSDLPQKDKDEMMEKLMVVFMACDLINNSITDFNSIFHRTKPDVDITSFNDIRQLSEMARQKLQYLQDYGDYMQDLVWGDKCDNLYKMALSKARSIIRKRKENKDWGKNAEKFKK